jgi:ABC-type multidrug transport system fused ATPase/permease subunit
VTNDGSAGTAPRARGGRDDLIARRVPMTLWGFVRHSSGWHQLWLLVISTLVFLASTAPLEVQRRLVNEATNGDSYRPIILLALTYAGLALVEGVLKLAMNMYRAWISEHAVRSLRRSVQALLDGRTPREAGETQGVGVSMILAEAEPIGGFVGSSVSEPLLQAGILMSVLAYMIYLQPLMALVAVAVFSPQIALVPFVQRAINTRVRSRIRTLRRVSIAVTGGAVDDPLEQRRRINKVLRLNLSIFRLKFSLNFLMNLLTHWGTAGILALGGWYVVNGETEIGTVVAFVSGLAKITDPWRDLINWYREMNVTRTKYVLLASTVHGLLAIEPDPEIVTAS